MRRRRAGFTIIEMATVAFLLLIVMAMVGQMTIPSMMMFKSEASASEARETALVLVARLQRGLVNSDLSTVTIYQNPVAVSYIKVADFDASTGQPKMEDHFELFFYDSANTAVRWRSWKPSDVPTIATTGTYDFTQPLPPRLSPDDLKTICTQSASAQIVSRDVSGFTLSDQDNLTQPGLSPPLTIRVDCAVEASGAGQNRPQKYSLTAQITPRSVHW